MALLHWMRSPLSAPQISSWAVELARRSHAAVSQRLSPALLRMGLMEARGYIRARAAAVVASELDSLVQRTGCSPALAAIVRKRAIDEVVRLAIGDLLKSTRQTAASRKAA